MATIPKGDIDLKLTARERQLIEQGLDCRASVLRRRINVEENLAIAEVLQDELKAVLALSGRL